MQMQSKTFIRSYLKMKSEFISWYVSLSFYWSGIYWKIEYVLDFHMSNPVAFFGGTWATSVWLK